MIEQINISNIIYFLILFVFVSLVLDRDENNLDRYDRYWAYEEKEYSRGITGIIYDKYGNSGSIINYGKYYIYQPLLLDDITIPLYYRMNLIPLGAKKITLDIGDANWSKVLNYIGSNKELGLPKIVKNLEAKYNIKAVVKKELSKAIK